MLGFWTVLTLCRKNALCRNWKSSPEFELIEKKWELNKLAHIYNIYQYFICSEFILNANKKWIIIKIYDL